jgi:hypothetical protein
MVQKSETPIGDSVSAYELKGDALMEKAAAKAKKIMFFANEDKYDAAASLYCDAAAQFKMAKACKV